MALRGQTPESMLYALSGGGETITFYPMSVDMAHFDGGQETFWRVKHWESVLLERGDHMVTMGRASETLTPRRREKVTAALPLQAHCMRRGAHHCIHLPRNLQRSQEVLSTPTQNSHMAMALPFRSSQHFHSGSDEQEKVEINIWLNSWAKFRNSKYANFKFMEKWDCSPEKYVTSCWGTY